jgi:hypothetical protein
LAPRVLSGRHGSPQLSVRSDLVSHRVPAVIFSFLIAMTALTVAFAFVLHADGTRHPALLSSVVVAALVLAGGPSLMAAVRRRTARRLDAV